MTGQLRLDAESNLVLADVKGDGQMDMEIELLGVEYAALPH